MPSLQPIWVENPEEEPKTTLYGRITNSDTPPLYDDIMNSDLSKEDKVKQIQYRTQAYQDDLDKQLNKDLARMKAGTALSAASFHPFFNIPYVGTGIGGAMYDLGQGIVEGDTAGDLAKRAGRGFFIGETIGAIPYVGKKLGKTKAGQAVINSAPVQAVGNVLNKAGEKFANSKLYDALMTDVIPNSNKQPVYYHGTPYTGKINRFKYDPTKQTGTDFGEAYYFTNDFDNASGYGYDVTKDIDIIKLQNERKNIISKGLDAFENGDMQTYYETQKMLKNNSKNIQDTINTGRHNKTGGQVIKANLDFKNPYIADAQGANYFDVYPNYFKNAREGGYDSIIARNVLDSSKTGLGPSDIYIAFSPDQIHQINQPDLYQQLTGKQNTGALADSIEDKIDPGDLVNTFFNINDTHIENIPPLYTGERDINKVIDYIGNNGNIKTPIDTVILNKNNLYHYLFENNPERLEDLNKVIRTFQEPNLIIKGQRYGNDYNYYAKPFKHKGQVRGHLNITRNKPNGNFYQTNFNLRGNKLWDLLNEGQVIYNNLPRIDSTHIK